MKLKLFVINKAWQKGWVGKRENTKAGRSKNHFAPCQYCTPLSPTSYYTCTNIIIIFFIWRGGGGGA